MTMKKKLTMIVAVVALAAFSLVTVAAVNAHGPGGSSEHLDRVAEILGVSPDELSSAVEQARSEARAARLQEKLETAVEDEVLTQEEADAIQAWFDGKPQALAELSREDRHGVRHAHNDGTLAEFLAGLVSEEVLTQAESDDITSWFDARPTEALETLKSEYGERKSRHHRGPSRGHFGFRGHGGFGQPAPETEGESSSTAVAFY